MRVILLCLCLVLAAVPAAASPEEIAALEGQARSGDAAALFALGDRYERGDEVDHDLALAAAYLRLAAERGLGAAQYRLGLMQAGGLGVEVDLPEGYKWLSLAAGDAEEKTALLAQAMRSAVAARLTPAEVKAAEAEIAAFKEVAGAVELPQRTVVVADATVTAEALQTQLPRGGCGPLAIEASDTGRFAVAGYLARGRAANLLAPEVKSLFERHAVELRFQEVEPNLCQAIEVIALAPRPRTVGQALVLRDGNGAEKDRFVDGDRLVIDIPAEDADRYIAVDYFQHDGQVLHLVTAHRQPAQQPLTLADPNWTIAPPYGQDMVVVLSSPQPLFEPGRALPERAADYVAEVKVLQAASGARALYRIITTAAQ